MAIDYFVSAGLLRPKKRDSGTNRLNRYLNYPLVGLASIAARSGSDVRVIHGSYSSPGSVADQIVPRQGDRIFLSLPSAYSLDWAEAFLGAAREHSRQVSIVCGGRWVVDRRAAWVRRRLGDVELVEGLGENFIAKRFSVALPEDPVFRDYTLMPDYLEFQPSVEVGRGCGRGCEFCVESRSPLSIVSSGSAVAHELARLRDLYSPLVIRPFLQASLFQPSERWVSEFVRAYHDLGLDVTWRAESRVDSINIRRLELLAGAGLRVLDLGLESAAHESLVSMGKTTNPQRYLQRASQTLRACSQLGVWVKLNIVLYAGDSWGSFNRTRAWLDRHSDHIKGVSANPLIYYPTTDSLEFPDSLTQLGATLVNASQLAKAGYADLHLSKDIDHESALNACLVLSRDCMDERDYFELKQFGYFSPSLTFPIFRQVVALDDPDALPFRTLQCEPVSRTN